jgi:hypothetical protein
MPCYGVAGGGGQASSEKGVTVNTDTIVLLANWAMIAINLGTMIYWWRLRSRTHRLFKVYLSLCTQAWLIKDWPLIDALMDGAKPPPRIIVKLRPR